MIRIVNVRAIGRALIYRWNPDTQQDMADKANKSDTLDGTVERVVFHNPANGWTVLRIQAEGTPLLDTVVGHFQKMNAGEKIRFTGRWTVDPRHGRQFTAETCLPLAPATVKGIEKFLGSGLIPGVGPVMAGRIVERFGVDTLNVIEVDPARLAEVSGIGSKRAKSIQEALISKRAVQDVMVFLESAGISPAFAHRIYKRYGNDAIRLVSENPFRLASEVRGIGFLSADRIASHLGIPSDSPHRAEAGLLFALEEFAKDGHVFAHQRDLTERASQLLKIDIVALERSIDRLVLMGGVRRKGLGDEGAIYLPRLHRAEEVAAKKLIRLLKTPAESLKIDVSDAIKTAESNSGIELAKEQRRAFSVLTDAKVMVLTGGPGTGKTTLLRYLTSCLDDLRLNISLAAPTGRAARRLAEATGRDARTLHRLLEFSPRTMRFERNGSRPLDAEMMIVDEVSMVDIELFAALLEALRPNSRLLLVGDPDQLPSIGPGMVLSDLLTLARKTGTQLTSIGLTEIFRQARSSLIVTGAHDVLAGYEPKTGQKGTAADLFFVEREDPEDCLGVIRELLATRIPNRFGLDPVNHVQVLTPMHKGLLGATNLNRELQDLLNPSKGPETTTRSRFRLGDKVMQMRNNYDLEVFNGDIGRVSAIGHELDWIEVTFPDRTARYPDSELDQLALAYACSVHKSQGSEYPAVVIPLHTQHFVMLQRNLLYTAITRGKRLVVLVGTKRALRIAVRNDRKTERSSKLAECVLNDLFLK
ncbi:MAG: ATP-dependent RecD-like DNA helicase [Proteobacteria bacterium]|nr:ATP-dependent RecD-like DNA helicase [Pseudomonadota bacterium]